MSDALWFSCVCVWGTPPGSDLGVGGVCYFLRCVSVSKSTRAPLCGFYQRITALTGFVLECQEAPARSLPPAQS